MGLIDRIGAGPLGLDTSIFLHFIRQTDPGASRLVDEVFTMVDEGGVEGATSGLTLLEVLTAAYRAGDQALAERYEEVLTRSRRLRVVELDRPLLRAAAALRATFEVSTPDAIQLAAALRAGCTAFLTDSRPLPDLPSLTVLRLGSIQASG